jgi:hypothetical protein
MHRINWALIHKLPADGVIISGGPEYGCFRCAHVPGSKYRVAMLLAEVGNGLMRRLFHPGSGRPAYWGAPHLTPERIERYTMPQ